MADVERRSTLQETAGSRLDLPAKTLLDSFGAGNAVPGSGSANAFIAVVATELVRSIAAKTRAEESYRSVHLTADQIVAAATRASAELRIAVDEDANDFAEVIALRRERDKKALFAEIEELAEAESLRREIDALRRPTEWPLRVATLSLEVTQHALTMFDHGYKTARGEALSAANGALAAAGSSVFVADLNLRDISRKASKIPRNDDLMAWVETKAQQVAALQVEQRRLRRVLIRRLSAFRKPAAPRRRNR